ncbi:MAG: hypothetical protein WBF58_09290 [Xanthobacteraceae bacterium]
MNHSLMVEDNGEARYSLDHEVNQLAMQIVAALEKAGDGEPDFGTLQVQKMRKIETLAMKADAKNAERRFRPGNRLRTYTGTRNQHGHLQDETYAGEACLTERSTIYRNIEPIRYADDDADPAKRGLPIRGRFEADGTFVEDAKGPDILYNEYANEDSEHAKMKYGIEPKPGIWTHGAAQIPSYLVQIPEAKREVLVKAGDGKLISVKGGDFLVADVFGPGRIGVHAIDLGHKERTYRR